MEIIQNHGIMGGTKIFCQIADMQSLVISYPGYSNHHDWVSQADLLGVERDGGNLALKWEQGRG